MACHTLELSRRAGAVAAACAAVPVLVALAAVTLRGGGAFVLGPGDLAAVRFTVWQAFWSAAISVALAVPLARALARRRFAGRGLLVLLLGAPFLLPVIVAVLGLLAVFGRAGWVSHVLQSLGLPELSIYGPVGVVLAHVFFNLPLATRLLLQGWQAIPAERFRLAGQLGLPAGTMFRVIEWPLLKQVLPGAFFLIFVLCLTSFAVALTLGGGPRATTVELAIYEAFRFDFDLGRAAFLSLLQLCLAGGAATVALWLVPPVVAMAGLDRPVRRWDAQGFGPRLTDVAVIGLAAVFLSLPLAAVVLRGLSGLSDLPLSAWQAAATSLWVAGLSAVVLLALALPMAGWLVARRRSLVETIGLLGLAVSPLTLGTGAFLLLHPVIDPGRWALLFTAFVNALMALPFALRILVPALRVVIAEHGRLALSLGLRGWRAWRIVALPRIRPQVGFAAGLGAALSAGDLGVIALFSDPDRATLPLQMYRLMGSYRTDAAAGAALVLLVLALGLFWIFDAWGRRGADA